MAEFPAELSTGMVHGRFIVALIDGNDIGQEPDVIPAQGKVAFKASVGYIPVPVATGGPVTVMKGPIMGVLDDDGYLSTPHPTTGEPMYRGVKLLATDDPDMAVTDWTWAADYRFESVNGVTLQIPAHSFVLPSGTVVDLTTMVKVPSSPGYGLPQAEAAALRAEAAAQVALDVKAMADAGEFDGAQGPAGNATMRVDTTVGTRVFITDGTTERMVSADTGWRDISALITGLTAGTVRVRRTANYTDVQFSNVECARGVVFQFPVGWGPRSDAYANTAPRSGDLVGSISLGADGRLYVNGPVGGAVRATLIAPSQNIWPTTIPGTPA